MKSECKKMWVILRGMTEGYVESKVNFDPHYTQMNQIFQCSAATDFSGYSTVCT
jgi:hypothetical protein